MGLFGHIFNNNIDKFWPCCLVKHSIDTNQMIGNLPGDTVAMHSMAYDIPIRQCLNNSVFFLTCVHI